MITPTLDTLTRWMCGRFHNHNQAIHHSDYVAVQVVVVPIWPERKHGRWLYAEQAVARQEDAPYRQRVYQLAPTAFAHFQCHIFTLPRPEMLVGAWRDPAPLTSLAPADLNLQTGCTLDVVWKDGRFTGQTNGSECGNTHRGASYATSTIQIGPDGYTSWDRGYNQEGVQVWGATAGPYEFQRIP